MDIEAKLSQARSWLDELGNAVSDLVGVAPEVFEDEKLKQDLADFRRAYDQAVQDLANPSLRIAMIGTTSSGKSTIVNALIGRQIAPTEAGEMSGGVLRIKHGEGCYLKIEATEEAVWETGEWTDLSDEEIYNRIQNTMNSYHQGRNKADYIAPQIEVKLPIFPGCDRELSGLPEGLAIEFFDLPGLKSVKDTENLKIIQSLVGNAFSLVALDYNQVDEEHREVLLDELGEVVEYLKGSTQSMIFILNRIDLRNKNDIPLEIRVSKLKDEIQSKLRLTHSPDLLSLNGLLFSYAQCAWGVDPLKGYSNNKEDIKISQLKSLFSDCSKTIEFYSESDYALEDWVDNVKKNVKRQSSITDGDLKKIVHYSFQWSGGSALWECIRTRLVESFSELVIIPALLGLFKSCDVLFEKIKSTAEVKKISTKEEVEKAIKNINAKKINITQLSRKKTNEMKKNIEDMIGQLKISLAEAESKQLQDMADGFKPLVDTVRYIETDLNANIIDTLTEAFAEKISDRRLKESLGNFISLSQAEDISDCYGEIRGRIEGFSETEEFFTKKVEVTNTSEIKKLEHLEKYYRILYGLMKDALRDRAKFIFQAQSEQCISSIISLVDAPKNSLIEILEREFNLLNLDKVILSNFEKRLFYLIPELPEDFLEISDNIHVDVKPEKIVSGTRNTGRTEGSCFDKHPVYESVYKTVDYKEIKLPKPSQMAEDWIGGIKKQEEQLWDNLSKHIIGYLESIYWEFEEVVNKAAFDIDYQLNKQLETIDNNFRQEILLWENIQNKNDDFYQSLENLKCGLGLAREEETRYE